LNTSETCKYRHKEGKVRMYETLKKKKIDKKKERKRKEKKKKLLLI